MSWNRVIGQEQQVRVLRSALQGGLLLMPTCSAAPKGGKRDGRI